MADVANIPQPRPVPVLGNLPDIDTTQPVQSMMRLAQAHGPIFRLSIGGRSLVVLGSQEFVDEVCDEARFGKKAHKPLEMIRDFAGDGLFTAHSEEPNWAMAHRLLMPAFGPLGICSMFDRMEDIADQMLLRWERFSPDTTIDVADNEMHPFVGRRQASAGAHDRDGRCG